MAFPGLDFALDLSRTVLQFLCFLHITISFGDSSKSPKRPCNIGSHLWHPLPHVDDFSEDLSCHRLPVLVPQHLRHDVYGVSHPGSLIAKDVFSNCYSL